MILGTVAEIHHGRTVRCFSDRPRDLNTLFALAVDTVGERLAIVCAQHRYSYGALEQRVNTLSRTLLEAGAERGHRVLIRMANGSDYLAALLAVWRLGAIAVPHNIREGPREIEHVLADSGAHLALCDAAHMLTGLLKCIDVATVGLVNCGGIVPVECDEDDVAVLLFTSGTTGRAKGVILTHLNIIHSCLHYRTGLGLIDGERGLLSVPASHVTGLVAILATMLACRGTTIALETFTAAGFHDAALREQMTYTLMVPAMYALCLRDSIALESLTGWRVAGFGGAPMPLATLESFTSRLPRLAFSNVYGATETASPATIMPAGETAARLTSVGRAVACGNVCIDSATGEIMLAGPHVSPGYWGDREATAAAFVDGFWRSGDVGRLDAEGFLFLSDRIKDMINRGGYKIYSVEVEHVLAEHAFIVEAAVVGVPCDILGQRIRAIVVLLPGMSIDLAAARVHVGAHLADYKRPDELVVCDGPLPRNAAGKVLKSALR